MSSLVVQDRIDELSTKLERIRKKTDASEAAYQLAQGLAYKISNRLMANAPRGTVEPDYTGVTGIEAFEIGSRKAVRVISHGRPSMRLHGVTLQQAWGEPEVEKTTDGAQIGMTSSAPQMVFLLEGSQEHPISSNPYLSFWHHKAGEAVITKSVSHPGHPPSDFVEQADAELGSDYSRTLDQMVDRILRPLGE